MTVTGIIAEYNPFHNGHAYQILQARKQTGTDYIVVVMSGDYVQRGTPAILEKHLRARMALEHGAAPETLLPAQLGFWMLWALWIPCALAANPATQAFSHNLPGFYWKNLRLTVVHSKMH